MVHPVPTQGHCGSPGGRKWPLSWGWDPWVGFRGVDGVLPYWGGWIGGQHAQGTGAGKGLVSGVPFTSKDFTAPTASGPSSVTHFLEPSTRCSTGMPRLASMNVRGLKPLKKGCATAPTPASRAPAPASRAPAPASRAPAPTPRSGVRTAATGATGFAKFIKKATAANTVEKSYPPMPRPPRRTAEDPSPPGGAQGLDNWPDPSLFTPSLADQRAVAQQGAGWTGGLRRWPEGGGRRVELCVGSQAGFPEEGTPGLCLGAGCRKSMDVPRPGQRSH